MCVMRPFSFFSASFVDLTMAKECFFVEDAFKWLGEYEVILKLEIGSKDAVHVGSSKLRYNSDKKWCFCTSTITHCLRSKVNERNLNPFINGYKIMVLDRCKHSLKEILRYPSLKLVPYFVSSDCFA